MRILLQRVSRASVTVRGGLVAEIGPGFLLLVGVTRDQAAHSAVSHVDEARAVDSVLGHPAPFVGRSEVGTGLRHGV